VIAAAVFAAAWDEDLLHRCAEGGRYIASLDALQVSPEYRQYIT